MRAVARAYHGPVKPAPIRSRRAGPTPWSAAARAALLLVAVSTAPARAGAEEEEPGGPDEAEAPAAAPAAPSPAPTAPPAPAPRVRAERRDVALRLRRLEEALRARPEAFAERRALVASTVGQATLAFFGGDLGAAMDRLSVAGALLEKRRVDDLLVRLERVRLELPPVVRLEAGGVVRVVPRVVPLGQAPPDALELAVEGVWISPAGVVPLPAGPARPFSAWRRDGLPPVDLPAPGRWRLDARFLLPSGAPPGGGSASTLAEVAVILAESERAFLRAAESWRTAPRKGGEGTPPGVVPSLDRLRQRIHGALAGVHRDVVADVEAEIGTFLRQGAALDAALAAGRPWRPTGADLPRDGHRATASGAAYRLAVPALGEGWLPGTRVPLVLALHGAGGTEDMFFEAYGAGEILRQAGPRRWLVASPADPGRALEVLDDVRSLLPVDEARVYAVGHSLGAAALWRAALERPQAFAAVAPIAGAWMSAGRPDWARARGLSVLSVTGGLDPSRRATTAAYEAQRAAGLELTELTLPDLDHLLVVGEALPAVFRFFEPRARLPLPGEGPR